jgi:hypothetical protein
MQAPIVLGAKNDRNSNSLQRYVVPDRRFCQPVLSYKAMRPKSDVLHKLNRGIAGLGGYGLTSRLPPQPDLAGPLISKTLN